jgi:UDP-N-acetylglucosamine transferase subunit ALG13
LKEIDKLIEEKNITEEVFAQIGYSDYLPKNYNYKSFLDRNEFTNIMSKCDKVITHGGTGAIIGAVKKGKKVIAVPRLSKYEEHIDDHQLQIITEFKKMGFIEGVDKISELKDVIGTIDCLFIKKYCSNTEKIVKSIESYIEG